MKSKQIRNRGISTKKARNKYIREWLQVNKKKQIERNNILFHKARENMNKK